MVIHLDFLIPGFAMQHRLIIAFDALLTDVVVGGIVLANSLFIKTFVIVVINFRHVADHVRQVRPIGILAVFVAADVNAGKAVLVHREAGDFFIRQLGFQDHRFITATGMQRAGEGIDIVRRQVDNRRQFSQQRLHVLNFIGNDFNVMPGHVSDQRDAIAIENNPSRWGDRDHFDVILIGSGLIILILLYLQMVQIHHQRDKPCHYYPKGD